MFILLSFLYEAIEKRKQWSSHILYRCFHALIICDDTFCMYFMGASSRRSTQTSQAYVWKVSLLVIDSGLTLQCLPIFSRMIWYCWLQLPENTALFEIQKRRRLMLQHQPYTDAFWPRRVGRSIDMYTVYMIAPSAFSNLQPLRTQRREICGIILELQALQRSNSQKKPSATLQLLKTCTNSTKNLREGQTSKN